MTILTVSPLEEVLADFGNVACAQVSYSHAPGQRRSVREATRPCSASAVARREQAGDFGGDGLQAHRGSGVEEGGLP